MSDDEEMIDRMARAALAGWCGVSPDNPHVARVWADERDHYTTVCWKRAVRAALSQKDEE